jgi:hypothetical protein
MVKNRAVKSARTTSDGEYAVEEILDKKIQNGQILFKVKWEGYPKS